METDARLVPATFIVFPTGLAVSEHEGDPETIAESTVPPVPLA